MRLKQHAAVAAALLLASTAWSAPFRIVVTQDQSGEARKYQPLLDYLGKKGVEAKFILARDYPAAAAMFSAGEADGMFCGSGIAGALLIKGLAVPVVRPVSKDGTSTYWAVVLGRKGGPKFSTAGDFLKGKRVAFTALASSGDFYFRAIGAERAGALGVTVANHAAAIDALSAGTVDYAIVKNRVWDRVKKSHPTLELVGEDKGENPDGTLLVSLRVDKAMVQAITDALLAVKGDANAAAVQEAAGIEGYVKTTREDYKHTIELLTKAGVTATYDFK